MYYQLFDDVIEKVNSYGLAYSSFTLVHRLIRNQVGIDFMYSERIQCVRFMSKNITSMIKMGKFIPGASFSTYFNVFQPLRIS